VAIWSGDRPFYKGVERGKEREKEGERRREPDKKTNTRTHRQVDRQTQEVRSWPIAAQKYCEGSC